VAFAIAAITSIVSPGAKMKYSVRVEFDTDTEEQAEALGLTIFERLEDLNESLVFANWVAIGNTKELTEEP